MMMGYGSSSASSNLSPLAPPFTVDRSLSKPLVDLTEPSNTYGVAMSNPSLHNWFGTSPSNSGHEYFSNPNPESESFPSSNPYMYSSSSLSTTANYNNHHHHVPPVNSDVSPSTSFMKANAYYPSYVSPAIANDSTPITPHQSGYDLLSTTHVPASSGESSVDAYSQGVQHNVPWGGLWEGMAAWQQSNSEGVFCPNENFMNQGLYSSNYRSKYDVGSHAINAFDRVKHVEPANSEQMDYKSFIAESSNVVSTDYPAASSVSTSSVPVMFPHASLKAADSRRPLKWDSCLNDGVKVMKPSPGIVIRMPEAKHPSSIEKLDAGKELNDENFFRNNHSIVKEDDTYAGFGGKVCLDDKDKGLQVKQNEQLASDKLVSRDDLDQLSITKLGIQIPCISVGGLNTSADANEVINSVDSNSSSNNFDHHNPAVDSPCWKGAPTSRKTPFELSDPATKQDIKREEACSYPDSQGPQIPPLNASNILDFSPEKPHEIFVQTDDGISKNCLAPLKKPISREELGAEKLGFDGTLRSYSHRLRIQDDISELNEEYAKKLIDSSDLKIPLTEQQNPEEAKCSFGRSFESGNYVADVGININDDSDDCSSQVPYNAIENVLCSPPSAENVHNSVNRSHSGVSAPKICVRTLLKTMHNLSEFLLFSCSNDKCDLKEEDYETLESIINNLDLCILKNVEMMTSVLGSCNPHRANSQPFMSKIHKGANDNSTETPQVSAVNRHILFGKEHLTLSGKEDVHFSPPRSSAEIGEDKMTQSIKNILAQNFHDEEQTHEQVLLYKNLWLEAEASLCSVNYIARYNRMKKEMEKHGLQKANDKQTSSVLKPNLVSSDTKAGRIPDTFVSDFPSASTRNHADDVMASLQILKGGNCKSDSLKSSTVEKFSISNVSADQNMSDELADASNEKAIPDISLQDSCGPFLTSHVHDVTTSILDLKSNVGKSNSVGTSAAEQLSCFNYSLDPNEVSKAASKSEKEANPYIPHQDIAMPVTTSHVDDVTARFHVLKNRIENSNSLDNSALEISSSSKDSSELSNVDKLSHEGKNGVNKNASIQDFSMRNSVSQADDVLSQADDVMARFQVLTRRAENLKSVDTSVLEILLSSNVPVDAVSADKVENETKDGEKQDISIRNLAKSGTRSHVDDVEASVMARYQILKHRADSSASMYVKRHQPDHINLGFPGQRRQWPDCKDGIWGRIPNVNVDSLLQSNAPRHGEENSTAKEYHLFSNDDPMTHSESSISGKIEDQPVAGCYDNGSSDWEHVLKEELT